MYSEFNDQINSLVCKDCFPDCFEKCNLLNYGNSCVDKCPIKFYVQNNSLCLPCYSNCLKCIGPSSEDCHECIDNFYFYE